jgi:hypothetical protein
MPAIICAVVFTALLFRTVRNLVWRVLWYAITLIFWLVALAIPFGLVNSQQAYDYLGWTPISIICGDEIYHRQRKALHNRAARAPRRAPEHVKQVRGLHDI